MIERDFYPLSELAKRWGCSASDLLHLGIQGRAQVCANIYGMATGMSKTRLKIETREPEARLDLLTDEEQREVEAHFSALERWKARTTAAMPEGVFELERDELRFLEMPGAFPYELQKGLSFDHRGWWEVELDPSVMVSVDHLCMLHEEVARLDQEVFRKADPATAARQATAPLLSRTETTYLNIIGGLLELVRSPRPGRDSDAAVIRELVDNYGEKPGISKATLETKFAEARRRLHAP